LLESAKKKLLMAIGLPPRDRYPDPSTADAPPVGQSADELSLCGVVIFYNFVFDLGGPVNPTQVARKLLREDFAISAANYRTGEVEQAERFETLLSLRGQAQDLLELKRQLDLGSMKGLLGWAVRHPSTALMVLRLMRGAKDTAGEPEEPAEQADQDLSARMDDVVRSMDEMMTTTQLMEALQHHCDRELFTPSYLGQLPFARVSLQPFRATIEGEDIDLDVDLLVHRAGVGVLRFYALFDNPKSVDDVVRLQIARNARISRWRMVRHLVEAPLSIFGLSGWMLDQGPYRRDHSGGVEWLGYDEADVTVMDVFEMYQTAVLSAVLGRKPRRPGEPERWLRIPDWFAYPLVFVRDTSPRFATSEDFKRRHARALAGIVQRSPRWRDEKQRLVDEALREDHARTEDESFYIGSSHAVAIYYGGFVEALEHRYGEDIPGQEWLSSHFYRSALVDALLVQFWILRTVREQLASLSYGLERLNSIKHTLILAFEEYHNATLSYGDAQEIVKSARKTMGVDDLYAGMHASLANLEKLVETEESSSRHRRDLLLKLATTVVTLLLGLPAPSRWSRCSRSGTPCHPGNSRLRSCAPSTCWSTSPSSIRCS
jgi:hypothetical protein